MKTRRFLRGLLAAGLLVPALLIGFFLPRGLAAWQDRQLENSVTTYETEPVSLQLLPELSLFEKLRLVGSGYSAIYNSVTSGSTYDQIEQNAKSFLYYMGDFMVLEGPEVLSSAPFLAIQADDMSKTAILWTVDISCVTGQVFHLILDDETGIVLAMTVDLSGFYTQYDFDWEKELESSGGPMDFVLNWANFLGFVLSNYYGLGTAFVQEASDDGDGVGAACILCLENADGTDAVNLKVRLQGMRLACNE
jgi:hypothetical protein